MQIRHTLIFQSGQFGWTETYVDNNGGSIGAAADKIRSANLADGRSNILGVGAKIIAVRQSLIGASRQTFFYKNPKTNDGSWSGPSGAITSTALSTGTEVVPMSLRVRYECGAKHFMIRYHAGCPDPVFVGPNAYDLTAFNGGKKAWDLWVKYILQNGWGTYVVPVKADQVRQPVTAVAFNGQGQGLFTCAIAAPVGTRVTLSTAKFSTRANINYTFTVASNAGGVVTTVEPIAIIPNSVYLGKGTLRTATPSPSADIADVTVMGVSRHARGDRGFFQPRGKRKIRQLTS